MSDSWLDYGDVYPDSRRRIAGTVKVYGDLESQQLENRRDLFVYLPPDYDAEGKTYRTLYMHDGQNLFDPALSFAGSWRVGETMERLGREGIEAIVVGVPSMGERRLAELTPFADPRLGGGDGDAYLEFLATTVCPLIDASFATRPRREERVILGSSLGGAFSLYAFFQRSDIFGHCGALSPSLWFARAKMERFIQQAPFQPGRIYLDVGTRERSHERRDRLFFHYRSWRFTTAVAAMVRLLRRKGYQMGRDLDYVVEHGGIHGESSWGERLPNALRFLLA